MGNRIERRGNIVDIIVESGSETIATASFNPRSPLLPRCMANIYRVLEGAPSDDELDAPGVDDIGEADYSDIEKVKLAAAPMLKIADFIDNVISACDKLFGSGVTERILSYDNEKCDLLISVIDDAAAEMKRIRADMTSKYKV